jgi:integral membrane sensor domain MASE1
VKALLDKIAKRASRELAEEPARWHEASLAKQLLFAAIFLTLFLLLDGSSQVSQAWEGAPPCYLPVGMAVALLLYGGVRYVPLLFLSSVTAAVLNYHRPLFSWCGIPGATISYAGYIVGAALLRSRWRIDPKLGCLRDVIRFVVTFLIAEIFGATIGMLTLQGDGLVQHQDIAKTAIDWATSDMISILTFSPFLLVYVGPRLNCWFRSEPLPSFRRVCSWSEFAEMSAQAASVLVIICVVFGLAEAIPYQPLYLLFLPVIWAAVRRGIPGATLIAPAVTFGLTFAAWITQAPRGSLPELQLAILTIGLTSLFLGRLLANAAKPRKG